MTKPLALVFYENLLPGSQLANRLQDLGYRVVTIHDVDLLAERAVQEKPLLVITDLSSRKADVCQAIEKLKKNPATTHLPVLAFVKGENFQLQEAARLAGATLVAGDIAILEQLPQLLEQALEVE
ncbi:MAG: hypothetical protein M3Y82_07065 [Verrucomicrobiota bacterium]|nr:hypothetical protein [Verrucomicrobiota bacterium]